MSPASPLFPCVHTYTLSRTLFTNPSKVNFKLHNIGTQLYTTRLSETTEKKTSQNPIRDQVSARTTSYFLNLYTLVAVLLNKERMCLQCRRPGFDLWVGKIPWRREWLPTPVFLPRESPWTEEPGGLQSMGSQRVGHDGVIKHSTGGLSWWSGG